MIIIKIIILYCILIRHTDDFPSTGTLSKTTGGPRVSPLGDIPTRKYDDKGDQPCDGETLGKYWMNTIWQMTAQDLLNWRRHRELFAQPRDTTAIKL